MTKMATSTGIGTGGPSGGPNYKKVFIQRDYTEGTSVKFQTKFPQELNGLIDSDSFYYLVNTLNGIYADAEKMNGRAFCESCFACLSAYFAYLCMESYYDKCMRRVSAFIEEQNDTKWKGRHMLLTDPIDRGLRVLEITIFTDGVETNPQQQAPAPAPAQGQQQPQHSTQKQKQQQPVDAKTK